MNFMKNCNIILALFVLIGLACNSDDSGTEFSKINSFLGDYSILSEHITGIHTEYDSIGNIIFQGYDTITVSNNFFSIVEGSNQDTVILNQCLNDFNHESITVKAVLSGDELSLVHEFSDIQHNDYLRGTVRVVGDSIFMDYYWDRSNVWANYAPPTRGSVLAQGVRK